MLAMWIVNAARSGLNRDRNTSRLPLALKSRASDVVGSSSTSVSRHIHCAILGDRHGIADVVVAGRRGMCYRRACCRRVEFGNDSVGAAVRLRS